MTDKSGADKLDYKEALSQVEQRFEFIKTKWHANGEIAWEIYLGDEENIPFNILFSNTETIVPAVFSKKPLARVMRRYDEARADVPAKILQRFLSFSMDMNLPSYPSFMTTVEDAVMDSALPGQGLFRVRLVGKLPILDYVPWKKFAWGYAERWEDVPWIAFAHDLTKNDLLSQFPKLTQEQKDALALKIGNEEEPVEDSKTNERRPGTVRVWERWDKRKKIRDYLCDAVPDCCLMTEEDPLKLEGFYPIPPKPLTFLHSTTDTLPRPLYKVYQDQAEELNEITIRLRKIIKAIRVRGIYMSGVEDIPRIFEENDDNVLIPTSAAQAIIMQGKGLDAFIWLLPIEKLIVVAKELYTAREAIKQTIYEILGIGDILRGVSKASETLGAQEIKDKWGSVRINRMRERTAEFIRDGLRLLAEVGLKHTPPDLWSKITGVTDLATPEQLAALPPGNPPPQPMATWAGVLEMLRDDLSRAYLVDIEANSSVDSAATQEKAEMAEFMNAFGQTMSSLHEIMSSSPQGWELGKVILDAIASKFDLGEEVSPQIRKLPPPAAVSGPPPEVQKMQQDAQKAMEDAKKLSETAKADEQLAKDTLAEAQRASEALTTQKEDLQKDREAIKRDIEMAKKEALLEIQEAKVNLAMEKASFAGEKAAVEAKAKAMQGNKPANKPSGGK